MSLSVITCTLPVSLSLLLLPSLPSLFDQLMSVDKKEEMEEEVFAEGEEQVPVLKKGSPAQQLPELQSVRELKEPTGQTGPAEEGEGAQSQGPPRQDTQRAVKEEL